MPQSNVIVRTGQLWKVVVADVLLVSSGAGMVYAQSQIGEMTADRFTQVMLGSTIVGLISFSFGCLAIRCPQCGLRWVWNAVRTQDVNRWLVFLMRLRACPGCERAGENLLRVEEGRAKAHAD